MKISFEGSPEEVVEEMLLFLRGGTGSRDPKTEEVKDVPADDASATVGKSNKGKSRTSGSRRRTSNSVGGDSGTSTGRGDEASDTADAGASVEGKATSRRRKSAKKPEATGEASAEPTDGGSDISDKDIAKAASNAAARLTPKVVKEILDQFGTGNVAELTQEQRAEFIELLDAAMEDV